MNALIFSVIATLASSLAAQPVVSIDQQAFGANLGGWTKRSNQAAEYQLSGASYRTYKPEVTTTPDGGLFVSLRIDNVRGWLASDDHAMLEITVSAKGNIESAQSTIAIQGRSITSDLIRSGNDAGQKLVGMDRAVKIGTDLVADLTAKMLLEKLVEPGRVSYPAVLRHNYNLLFQAIRTEAMPIAKPVPSDEAPPSTIPPTEDKPVTPPPTAEPAAPVEPPTTAVKLEIKGPGDDFKPKAEPKPEPKAEPKAKAETKADPKAKK
ncbi:MAG: hypothetical protein WCP35_20455 [Verrucomicrobiota bacterium]